MTLRPEELVRIGGDPNIAPKVLPHPRRHQAACSLGADRRPRGGQPIGSV